MNNAYIPPLDDTTQSFRKILIHTLGMMESVYGHERAHFEAFYTLSLCCWAKGTDSYDVHEMINFAISKGMKDSCENFIKEEDE